MTGAPNTADGLASLTTYREVVQQPAVWREAAETLAARSDEVATFLEPLFALPDLRIVLTGAGTSAFAGEVLAPALARTLRRRVDAVATTDIVSNPREMFAEDVPTLLVSFARSGDSPESVAATQLATTCLTSVHQLVITCNPEGQLAREHSGSKSSLVLLMPSATNDRGFAMTSSFTSMLLTAWLTLAPDQDPRLAERLAAAAEQVLDRPDELARLTGRPYDRVVYLGSGSLGGLARESALKLLELTAGKVISFYDTPLGFRHGPKAVLKDGTLAVVYLSNDAYTRQYDHDIVEELRAAIGAENVLAVSAQADDAECWQIDGVADVDDAVLTLPFVVIAQLLALRFSVALGRTPDNPFPDGEVNRVVQGVTIHPLQP
ncbi:SIS domain-containing protein [Kribbella sp. NPDC050281]|uniref:SIS domain-containing protein n=1 Tax=Kribbella sp. NPDC050281 TaxID=3155515 RepID=UPI0033FC2644